MSATPWMSVDADELSAVAPLALAPEPPGRFEDPAGYVPRRALVEEPIPIAPRRAISFLEASAPRSATEAAIQAALAMPSFPPLTWTDLQRGQEDDQHLDGLRARGWQVLHSVPVGSRGSAIDHVLMGPGGVFLVDTTSGRPTLHLRFEADRASKFLSGAVGWPVEVTPVLVVDDAARSTTERADGFVVVNRDGLAGYFCRLQPELATAEVADIFEYARRSSTWS